MRKLGGLGIYNLSTGQRQAYIDLGGLKQGGRFCKDIALNKAGNAYIRDNFSSILDKVDIKKPRSCSCTRADGLFWAGNGTLIVIVNTTTNKVFKLSSSDN